MSKFSIGEVAILLGSGENIPIGTEIEIIGYANPIEHGDFIMHVPGYPSPHSDEGWAVWENQLRKKQPPEELSNWDEVEEISGWSPVRETINATE